MTAWTYIVVIASVLMLGFLCWQEATRSDKSRLTMRLVASVLAVASLACMSLPVTYPSTKTSGNKALALLTAGFSTDSLDQFIKSNPGGVDWYALDHDVLQLARAYHPKLPPGDNFYASNTTMHVFGNGLGAQDLQLLNSRPIVFHPVAGASGFTSVSWTRTVTSGKKFYIQGSAKNLSARPAKIVLAGFQTNLDSAVIAPGKEQEFELGTIPSHQGRAAYSLALLSGTDTLEKEPIPFQVNVSPPVRILVLAAFPDFENKFLKNWLFSNGFQIAIRTAISKNKFNKEYLNLPAVQLDHINPSLLAGFDVVISDGAALSALTGTERYALRSQVEQQGMGLVIRTDSALGQSVFYGRQFPIVALPGNSPKLLNLLLDSARLPGLPVSQPVFIRSHPGTQSLLNDDQSRIVASSALAGSGKIVLTTLANTYSWVLSGNENAYSSLWSMLIEKAARKTTSAENWFVDPGLPRVNEPAELSLSTGGSGLPHGKADQVEIALKQSAQLPFRWTGLYWPREQGWHALTRSGGTAYWWYAFGRSAWQTASAGEKIQETKKYAAEHPLVDQTGAEADVVTRKAVPKIYFFLVLLLSCSYLWAEKKYAGLTNVF